MLVVSKLNFINTFLCSEKNAKAAERACKRNCFAGPFGRFWLLSVAL
ncbi:hypothetical protein HMPREF6485_2164 [Segatella buccae ATCC 33574]|uniref:Uncharacterized protein n=1 Tax=Segatella buccae ATCC 33574 TaxID=873513 RepID=E6K978_9BACT|nr:hypothetical protein HMPREF6485_2164 [Segatella buccae ATCC 33574]